MEPSDYVGATFSSTAQGEPHISFSDDGTFKLDDGCNGAGGEYTVEDDRIVLDPIGYSTLKACTGVDDWLRAAKSVEVENDTLTVFNSSGDEIGTLTKG